MSDSCKITEVTFSELFEKFEKYNNRTVKFIGNIDCFSEHQCIHPPANSGDYSNKLWFSLPEKIIEKDYTRLSEYSGRNGTIVATVRQHSSELREGKGYLILYKVVFNK